MYIFKKFEVKKSSTYMGVGSFEIKTKKYTNLKKFEFLVAA